MALREEDVESIKWRAALAVANSNSTVLRYVLEDLGASEELRGLVENLANMIQTLSIDLGYLVEDRKDLLDVIELLGGDS